MNKPLKFLIRVPSTGQFARLDTILATAKLAERLGFYGITFGDHIIWSRENNSKYIVIGNVEKLNSNNNPDYYEPIVTASLLAGLTSDVKLAFTVLQLPLRNPILAAKQIATLDVLSNGRVIMGVGVAGILENDYSDFDAMGANGHKRGLITDEYITAIKTIWKEDKATFNGKYLKFKDVQIYPKPLRGKIPIWIGGSSKRAIERAALHGDCWLPSYADPDSITNGLNQIRNIRRKNNLPEEIDAAAEVMFCIARSKDNVVKKAASTLVRNASAFPELSVLDAALARNLVGTPFEIVTRAKKYQEIGVHFIELKTICDNFNEMAEMMELLAADVMPSLAD